MKHYNFITEDVLKAKTHWSKSGQVNAINELVSKYPSPKQFKDAVKKNGDKKSIQLIQSLPDNASRNDYIDFLQTVFTKYSTLGKNMLSAAAGVGIGAAAAYATGKAADAVGQDEKTGNLINDKTGDYLSRAGNKINKGIGKTATSLASRGYDKLASGVRSLGIHPESAYSPAFDQQKLALQAAGGVAGMGVGTLGAHGIQSWRQKKLQSKIDTLKNG